MKLTTTLHLLKTANACPTRYRHLVRALGGVSFDPDQPIDLLTILKHNGVEDCVWSLRATEQNCDTVARLMAADFAEAVLPIYEERYPNDPRPRQAIEAARAFARGEISKTELTKAETAASIAARNLEWTIGDSTAEAAASAAAEAATADITRAGARSAAQAAAESAAMVAVETEARTAASAMAKVIVMTKARDAARKAAQAARDLMLIKRAEIIRKYLAE